MSKLIDISSDEFWQILFDEACVEGRQAERIESELSKICVDDKEIHGYSDAIRELKQRFRNEYEEMMELEMEDCINWADWLDATAEQILADRKG